MTTEVVYLQRWHGWCHMKLQPCRRVLCTPYNHAQCHFMQSQSHMQSHIRKVHVYSDVTCHLRFWQNDRDLLRATAVIRRWNEYRNKSQFRKLTLLQGLEPATFQSRVRRLQPLSCPRSLVGPICRLLQSDVWGVVNGDRNS